MSHSHHGGGSSTTGTGSFKETNRGLAEAYWYLVAGAVGLAGVVRGIDYLEIVSRRKISQGKFSLSPSRPTGSFSRLWATATALCREASYPQLHVPLRRLTWLSPPHLGRVLVLAAYWAVIIYMMSAGAVIKDAFFWERIGFRNAWVSITQVPLVFMLSMKISPLTLVTGISHERLNWLHRWVARTLFVTATVHGFHFWRQWVLADFVEIQLKIMPMVKYGLGAWGVLLWTFVTSFYPLRSLSYELFVLQHIASAAVLLWLLSMHLPPVAMYNLWFSVALVAFDRVARWLLLARRNLDLSAAGPSPCHGRPRRLGHEALVRTEGRSTTVVTVRDVHLAWRPGQHLYLWMPLLGPLEAHPYTIASAHRISGECVCNSVELVVRRHAGFSARLHAAAVKAAHKDGGGDLLRTTAFVSGPYGNPPPWDVYDTVILISASTGASYTLPILEDITRSRRGTCLRRVEFALTGRDAEETAFYRGRVREALAREGGSSGVEICAHVAITGRGADDSPGATTPVVVDAAGVSPGSSVGGEEKRDDATALLPESELTHREEPLHSSSPGTIRDYASRLDLSTLIRDPVEAALGETLVVVCGGRPLVAGVRNYVAALSDERGVHKGTGAQGIRLHVEEYSF